MELWHNVCNGATVLITKWYNSIRSGVWSLWINGYNNQAGLTYFREFSLLINKSQYVQFLYSYEIQYVLIVHKLYVLPSNKVK